MTSRLLTNNNSYYIYSSGILGKLLWNSDQNWQKQMTLPFFTRLNVNFWILSSSELQLENQR